VRVGGWSGDQNADRERTAEEMASDARGVDFGWAGPGLTKHYFSKKINARNFKIKIE
jgi:hypothetical protein